MRFEAGPSTFDGRRGLVCLKNQYGLCSWKCDRLIVDGVSKFDAYQYDMKSSKFDWKALKPRLRGQFYSFHYERLSRLEDEIERERETFVESKNDDDVSYYEQRQRTLQTG
jgi:hypothetical protein